MINSRRTATGNALFLPSSQMGDTICSGLVYILTCCCCCSGSDPGTDGSGFCSGLGRKKKDRDPREKALKREFMGRGYNQDAVGRIHVQQPSKSQLMMTAMGQQPSSGEIVPPEPHSSPDQTKKGIVLSSVPPGIDGEDPP
ncbi:hypothetical protein C8F04DRAFT_1234344 [Mycena alexandri]|uniref:Uncharacterized protein n=1 Tax=Mycena alexandri TaxID=1745969 RepID=A0AAD6SUG1_9AGAR|nr:hypothetical protein C8F04DRAFT_1234344 [Mycena alexandri]